MTPINTGNLLHRRYEEWNPDNVKELITQLFKVIENNIPDWKVVNVEWSNINHQQRARKEELKRSITNIIKIELQDDEGKSKEYSIHVPKLINSQFFYIGGFLKIPIFQLFDDPIIYRVVNDKFILKFRNNILSTELDVKRDGRILINIFNKSIPIEKLITAVHTIDEFNDFFSTVDYLNNPLLSTIRDLCVELYSMDRTEEDINNSIGTYFMTKPSDKQKKGDLAIYSIKSAYNADIFTQKFMKTNSILFELLYALHEGPRSDTDLYRKRLRFSEYILYPLVNKIYDMMISVRRKYKDKFQIPQNVIIEKCNVSEIVHFSFPLNPVAEVASFLQCTLTGPGGFKKDNVPAHLRNLDDTQIGSICPADTPDREGCGVVLNLTPSCTIDQSGRFTYIDPEIINEIPVSSYPITLTPLAAHDDATRLQMASSQMKQTIAIKNNEVPMIKSGMESAFLGNTTFQHVAKQPGIVKYIDSEFMIVLYDNGQVDIFNIFIRPLNMDTVDIIQPNIEKGKRFNQGDILASSRFIKRNELALGKNLLTAVASWDGFNYEDGIVICEDIVDDLSSNHTVDLSFHLEPSQVLLTLDSSKYYPLPKVGQKLKKGDVYAKLKRLDPDNDYDEINEDPIERIIPLDCTITSIEIYPNKWNEDVTEFSDYMSHLVNEQHHRYYQIVSSLKDYLPENEIENFITLHGLSRLNCMEKKGNYSNKGTKFRGSMIKITAIHKEKIGKGDKVANRHGNKGVIARILPKEKMPILEDGRRIDIVINFLGIVSRMNVGQLNELHLSECLYQFKKQLINHVELLEQSYKEEELNNPDKIRPFKSCLEDENVMRDIEDKIRTFYEMIHVPEFYILEELEKFRFNVSSRPFNDAVLNLTLTIPSTMKVHPEDLFKLEDWTGAKETYPVYNPSTETWIDNPLAVGYMTFLKLVHRSSDKLAARSVGPYNRKTSQPVGGKRNQGGHRLGEMEVWAILGHGADNFLKDILTVHSDALRQKDQVLAEILQNPDLVDQEDGDMRPQSLLVFQSYLRMAGLDIDFGDNDSIVDTVAEPDEDASQS